MGKKPPEKPATKSISANGSHENAKEKDSSKANKEKVEKPKKEDDEEAASVDPKDPDEDMYKVEEKDPTGDHYTSVIIDASDFHITRSMSPKIVTADGTKIWPCLSYIDPEYVLSWGIVLYAQSLDDAKALKRAGKNPLVLRALAHGASADDPVLSETDVAAALAANKRNQCMDKFKVIFVLDKKPEAKPAEKVAAK